MATATKPAKARSKRTPVETFLLVFVLDRSGTRFLVHEIVLFTIDEHHYVCVLLNRTRLAQIRLLWMFVFAAFDLPR